MSQGTTKGVPIDTDGTLALNSDLLVPSQKAVKTYVDTEIAGVGGSTAAADVSITDAGGYFTGTDVEAALQELGASGGGSGSGITRGQAAQIFNIPTFL